MLQFDCIVEDVLPRKWLENKICSCNYTICGRTLSILTANILTTIENSLIGLI
jgi:hypothetical protein